MLVVTLGAIQTSGSQRDLAMDDGFPLDAVEMAGPMGRLGRGQLGICAEGIQMKWSECRFCLRRRCLQDMETVISFQKYKGEKQTTVDPQ
jgi:hypothetical protein